MPLDGVIEFKREVYRLALNELVTHLGADHRHEARHKHPKHETAA